MVSLLAGRAIVFSVVISTSHIACLSSSKDVARRWQGCCCKMTALQVCQPSMSELMGQKCHPRGLGVGLGALGVFACLWFGHVAHLCSSGPSWSQRALGSQGLGGSGRRPAGPGRFGACTVHNAFCLCLLCGGGEASTGQNYLRAPAANGSDAHVWKHVPQRAWIFAVSRRRRRSPLPRSKS